MELNRIYNEDCLVGMKEIPDGSVDLILTDPPYGTIKGLNLRDNYRTDWDTPIKPEEIYEIANKKLRVNGRLILFSQEPYTTELLKKTFTNIPFNYKAIWLKDKFANGFSAKKAMVNYYEEILIFTKKYEVGKNITPKNPVYEYLKKCKKESRITTKEFNLMYSNYKGKIKNKDRSIVARYWETSQFLFPSKDIYENVLQKTGFFNKSYEELTKMNENFLPVFNLEEGKAHKSNILEHKKEMVTIHPTQKPVSLIEDLVKTFSNEHDVVLDICMGSGTTAIACMNTNRNYIGFELDAEYCHIANERINAHKGVIASESRRRFETGIR